MSSETQCKKILAHLKTGRSITPLEALYKFGCLRLGARIYDLKQAGHTILSERIQDDHTGKTFAQYYMPPASAQPAP